MDGDDDDVTLRAYLASIIGAVRAPFGKRGAAQLTAGQSAVFARNTTKGRVLNVTVSRGDVASLSGATVIFSQQDEGGGSSNDFVVAFTATTVQRFVLKPGDVLTATVTVSVGSVPFVIGQETY